MIVRIGLWLAAWSVVFLGLALAGSWSLPFADDQALCSAIAQALDESALAEGRVRFDGPNVHSVEWQPVTVAGDGPKTVRCAAFEQAVAAIGPEGAAAKVIRSRFCMKGAPSDSLYLFPVDSDVLSRVTWQDLSPLHEAPNAFERTGGTYRLFHLPLEEGRVELQTLFAMDVLNVSGRDLVAISAPPFTWVVVGVPARQGALREQCYLRRAR